MTRTVRRATLSDVGVLVELRAEMFRAMGTDGIDDAAWRAAAAEWFAARIDDPATCIVVVESEDGVAATAMAGVRDSAPSPTAPTAGDVLISNICTLSHARGRGHGRAAFDAVMEWARTTGMPRAELLATSDGRPMYEAAGFVVTAFPAMRVSLAPTADA